MDKYTLQKYIDILENNNLIVESSIYNISSLVEFISYNSNDIQPNTMFICKGLTFKKEYLKNAISKGAFIYISESKYEDIDLQFIIVKDIRKSMPIIANIYYNNIWSKLKLIGITGTKGKSTTAYYIKYILDCYLKASNKNESAILSSIDNYDGVIKEESHLTTPESLQLNKHFKNAVDSDIEFLTMEVSSQALKYNRVDRINFNVGIFLNISEDHISPIEHSDFEDYFKSKLKLFNQCDTAIINMDCDFSDRVYNSAKSSKQIITYSIKNPSADVYGYDIKKQNHDILFKVRTKDFDKEFKLTMPGLFNVENALAAIAATNYFGIDNLYIYEGLEKARSSGRMEMYSTKDDKIIVIVDYAHNKLSFEKLFEAVKAEYPSREIISIFGCPGFKSLGRRKDLGTIAGKYSKKVYIVAEDPGYEPVIDISTEIAKYVEAQNTDYVIIEDRGEAIKDAIFTANENTIILVTGKGNETRQKYGSQYLDCISDVEFTKKYLEDYNRGD